MPPNDPHGWEGQRTQIIQQQQRTQQQQDEWMRAGGARRQQAQQRIDGYGAIALFPIRTPHSSGIGSGYSFGRPDQPSAERAAIEATHHPRAFAVCWGHDCYLALARGPRGSEAYGCGWGPRPEDAKKLALKKIPVSVTDPIITVCFDTRTGLIY